MRQNKTVSFNISDSEELAMYNHALKVNPLTGKAQNFSKYVKRLIDNDMKRTKINYVQQIEAPMESEVKKDVSSFL